VSVTTKNWPRLVTQILASYLPPEARRRVEVGLPQTLQATTCRGCGRSAFRVLNPTTVGCVNCNLETRAEVAPCFHPGYVNLRSPRTRLRILVRPHEATRRSSGLVTVTGWASQVDAGLCGLLAPSELPRLHPIIEVIGSRHRDHVWTHRLGLQVLHVVLHELGCVVRDARPCWWLWPTGEHVYDAAGPGNYAIRAAGREDR